MERWFIKATPVLGCKSSEAFLKKVEAAEKIKTGPVPTPKLVETLKRFIEDAGTDTNRCSTARHRGGNFGPCPSIPGHSDGKSNRL